jgi:cobalt/nickel transport system permease protein
MLTIEGTLLDFRRLDLFGTGKTSIHGIDARAKVLATLIFIISVVSFGKHEISALLPFFLFPSVLAAQGCIPFRFILKKVLLALPLALMVGIFNPLFDRTVLVSIGTFDITGGWISCLSIVIRTTLTVSSALVLISVTGFNNICHALKQMGVPAVFVTQLFFLYRYIFVLAEDVERLSNAQALRASGKQRMPLSTFAPLLGNLLLRTWDRAERIHQSMLSRGFRTAFVTAGSSAFNREALLFLLGWSALFIAMRFFNFSEFLGRIINGVAG